mmetsp:Transcript_54553/g.173331  ORF Transcript_54553/g.173331 Transcript_54553/m.173331 type:complete len:210 (+) Transcript_54553:687-1316(+)
MSMNAVVKEALRISRRDWIDSATSGRDMRGSLFPLPISKVAVSVVIFTECGGEGAMAWPRCTFVSKAGRNGRLGPLRVTMFSSRPISGMMSCHTVPATTSGAETAPPLISAIAGSWCGAKADEYTSCHFPSSSPSSSSMAGGGHVSCSAAHALSTSACSSSPAANPRSRPATQRSRLDFSCSTCPLVTGAARASPRVFATSEAGGAGAT